MHGQWFLFVPLSLEVLTVSQASHANRSGTEPPDVALEILRSTSTLFERSMVLVAGQTELTADKGIGITADKDAGPTGPLMFKIPLVQGSSLQEHHGQPPHVHQRL